jgi:putative FmdB family regulatory protein
VFGGDAKVPLYEYECGACGRFELIRKMSDAALTTCPKCGRDVQKLMSAPAIQFKGTGWYVTDYARKSPEAKGAGDAPASEASSSKDAPSSKDAKDSTGSKESSTPQSSTSKDSSASSSSSSK